MLLKSIKQECEEVAEGNNGRIRPERISVREDLYEQFIREIKGAEVNGVQKNYKNQHPESVEIIWQGRHWRYRTGGKEEEKCFEMRIVLHSHVMEETYKLREISCVECDNKPFQKWNGNYYCPACCTR